VSSHEIHHLLHQYGLALEFAVVFLQALGAPLPGTTALVAAALYAADSHGLPIAGVVACGALGALLGTCAGFGLGRWGGEPLLARLAGFLRLSRLSRLSRRPGAMARLERLRLEFTEHGAGWLFIGRFITGVRNVAGLLAGASGMPFRRFVLVSALAAVAWATINGLEYYFFGHALASASTWLQVLLVVLGLAWMGLSLNLLRRRALRRLGADAYGPAPPPAA
jgi:membrane protein DedA with SNARE-associated domain